MAKAKLFLLLTFLFFTADIFAQTYVSPYSRYGLGELSSTHFIKHRAMGSTSIAAMDENTFSLSNPASVAQVKSFMFETGFTGMFYELKTGVNQQPYQNYDFQLPYLSFALPLLKSDTARYMQHWGLNVALTPVSRISYQSKYSNSTAAIPTEEFFAGTGGFSKFSVGTGFQLIKNFYLGASAGYMFGQQNLSHASEVPDSFNAYNILEANSTIANGFVFDAGAIYKGKLGKTSTLQLGVSANLGSNINARKEEFAVGYYLSNFSDGRASLLDHASSNFRNLSGLKDTIYSLRSAKGKLDLPLGTGVGIQYTKNNAQNRDLNKDNTFTIAADVYQRRWSEYKVFGETQPITDLTTLSAGISFKPNTRKVGLSRLGNFMRRTEYRFGGRYSQGIYNLDNTLPVDRSLSFGIGMPFYSRQAGSAASFIDLTVEAGELNGEGSANNLQQRYLIISLGLHLSERGWFRNDRID